MKTKLNKHVTIIVLAGLFSCLSSFASAAEILYDQAFFNDSGSEQSITYISGWNSYYGGTGSEQHTKVRIQTAYDGVIWTDPNSGGFVVEGLDINVALSEVGTISIDTIQAKTAASVQFLIQVDSEDWYISNQEITPVTASNWQQAIDDELDFNAVLDFTTTAADWSAFTLTGSGITETPLIEDITGTSITGIGWYNRSTESFNYTRFDNLVVTAIPEASTSLFVLCGMLVIALDRRRLKRD